MCARWMIQAGSSNKCVITKRMQNTPTACEMSSLKKGVFTAFTRTATRSGRGSSPPRCFYA